MWSLATRVRLHGCVGYLRVFGTSQTTGRPLRGLVNMDYIERLVKVNETDFVNSRKINYNV